MKANVCAATNAADPNEHAQPDARVCWRTMALIGGLGLLIRLLYLWQIRHAPFCDLRIGDADAYDAWARHIAAGDWVGTGVFYQVPLYPYLLAVVYRFVGDSVLTVRLIQAVLGAASCSAVAYAGASLFGRRAGTIAGLGLALYPPAIYFDALLEKTSVATFFTAVLLALLATPPARMTARRWVAAGVFLGLLALTRENALLLIAPVLLWIALGPFRLSWRERLSATAPFMAGCLLVLLPVGVRNLVAGGEFHLTTSNFGTSLYIGNHPGADGIYQPMVPGHGYAGDERQDTTRLAEEAAGRPLRPGEVSDFWARRSLLYIATQPADWLKLMARKFALTFNAAEVADTESRDVFAEWSWLLRVLRPFDFGVLFALAVLGLVLTARSWRRLWFLYALAGAYAASVIVFFMLERYRFPMIVMLMPLAAAGLSELAAHLGGRRLVPVALAACVALSAFAFAHLPVENLNIGRSTHYLNIANQLSRNPAQYDAAMDFYGRALRYPEAVCPAQFGIGALLADRGRAQDAIPHYRAALALLPSYEQARYKLGLALGAVGRPEEALQEYSKALHIRPDDFDARLALAGTLLALNRADLAVPQYEQALQSRPLDAPALNGLGLALTQLGRPDEAIAKYQLALRIDPRNAGTHNNLACALADQGRLGEAIAHFERALELNPAFGSARSNLERARKTLVSAGRATRQPAQRRHHPPRSPEAQVSPSNLIGTPPTHSSPRTLQ